MDIHKVLCKTTMALFKKRELFFFIKQWGLYMYLWLIIPTLVILSAPRIKILYKFRKVLLSLLFRILERTAASEVVKAANGSG